LEINNLIVEERKKVGLLIKIERFCALFFMFYCFNFFAFANSFSSTNIEEQTEIKFYQGDNKINQVPYFDNRFRIDAELDEITLIFYRTRGSKPIILVQPDGAKIKIDSYNENKVQWHDDRTFDMIKIQKPMPGPWQAIGEILPNSQILVVSDITIEVSPLPSIIFVGETLKVVGKLFNGNKGIDTPYFREVIQLDVNFFSTNNAKYKNFNSDRVVMNSFRDDGRDLDEYSGDGSFTGEFVFDFVEGEWQPVYVVNLPMATRKLNQTPIILEKAPVAINVEQSDKEMYPHKMVLDIDPKYVVPESLVFQGKVTFPDKQVEPFSIMEELGTKRIKEIEFTEAGMYRINLGVFGETVDGREFRLVLKEYSFDIKAVEPTIIGNGTENELPAMPIISSEETLALALLDIKTAQEEKNKETMIIIAAVNLVILISLVVFFILRRRKLKKQ